MKLFLTSTLLVAAAISVSAELAEWAQCEYFALLHSLDVGDSL